MSEDPTKNLPASHSFEQKVLAWLEAIDARLQVLESKKYETKPIWERALKEIAEARQEMAAKFEEMDGRFNDLDGRIVVLGGDVLRLRAQATSETYPRNPYGRTPYEGTPPKPGESSEDKPADQKR